MPHNKLNISGATADVLSWVTHSLSSDETDMLRNVSRLPCFFKHVALMPDAHLGKGSWSVRSSRQKMPLSRRPSASTSAAE